MICLKTDRLIIRDQKPEDLNTYYALFSNKKAMYYLPGLYAETIEAAKKDFDLATGEVDKEDRKRYFFRIEDRQSGAHIGDIGYTVTETAPIEKTVGAGYFLYPEFWSKGYATEALREVIRFAFEEDNVYRIGAGCMKENVGSEKVMIKCGMIKEDEFQVTWHDGSMKDRVTYRLLKAEWEKLLSTGPKTPKFEASCEKTTS